jgi:hypothetical protein
MRIITLLLFLTALLTAQEGEHTCRTLFLNGPQQAPGKYYLFDGRSSQEVALPRLSFSPVYKLAPNSSALVNEPAGKLENYPVEVNFRVPGDERTHPLIESQWRHDPRSRSIVFVFDEGKRRAPKIRSFSDFSMPEKKEEE